MESQHTSAIHLLGNRADTMDEICSQKTPYRYRKPDASSQQCGAVGSSQTCAVSGRRDVIASPTDLHLYLQSDIHRRHHGRRSQTHGFHGRHSAKLTGRSLSTSRSTSQLLYTQDSPSNTVQEVIHAAVEDVPALPGADMVEEDKHGSVGDDLMGTKSSHAFTQIQKKTLSSESQSYNQHANGKRLNSPTTSKLETQVTLRLPPLLSNNLIPPLTFHELPSRTLKLLHDHRSMLLRDMSRTPRFDAENKSKRRFPPAALRSVMLHEPSGEVSQPDSYGEHCKQVMTQDNIGYHHNIHMDNAVTNEKLHDLPWLKHTYKMQTKGTHKLIGRQRESVFKKRGLQNSDITENSCAPLRLEGQPVSKVDPHDRIYPYDMMARSYPGLHDRACGVSKPVATQRVNATLMYHLRVAGLQHHPQNYEMTPSDITNTEGSVQLDPRPSRPVIHIPTAGCIMCALENPGF